jgi:hypothetical protein
MNRDMAVSKKLFTLITIPKIGDIKVGDVCLHPNNGYAYIKNEVHRTYAMVNNYVPMDIYILGSDEYVNGDYVVEYKSNVFGPVEQDDKAFLEDCRKIVATSDKELGLPLLPQSFLEEISTIPIGNPKIIIDVLSEQLPYVIDGYVTPTIPPTHFDLITLRKAYEEFAFSSDKPYNEADLENKFNNFLMEQINLSCVRDS